MSQVCHIHSQKEPCSDCATHLTDLYADERPVTFEPDEPMTPPRVAAKRPSSVFTPSNYIDMVGEEEDAEAADLGEFFDGYGIPTYQRIAMCRAYANYCAAKTKTQTPRGPYKSSVSTRRKLLP